VPEPPKRSADSDDGADPAAQIAAGSTADPVSAAGSQRGLVAVPGADSQPVIAALEPEAPLPRSRSSHSGDSRRVRSVWLLVISSVLFALMAVFAKRAAGRLAGHQVAWLRFCFGLAAALVLPRLLGRRLQPKNYRALILRGVFGGGAVLMYFGAIAHLPVAIATLLNTSSPIFMGLFAALFIRERPTLRVGLSIGVAFVGVTMVVLGTGTGLAIGAVRQASMLWALIGLGSAVLSGAAVTTMRSMRQSEGAWEIFAAFCLIGGLITGVPTALTWQAPLPAEWAWLGLMSVVSVAAQMIMTYALRDVAAVTAGLILQLTPISTFALGVLWLGERPSLLSTVGAVVTLVGVAWGIVARATR
jgi:drug/metabolite transporter (DMT)-like permease